ncbi:MAG: glycoside hydrolase family 2 protein [Ilumatobacteraceae bacterium]
MELRGRWVARPADDDLRRDGIGLDVDDSAWPEARVPGHWRDEPARAGEDGPLLYRHRFHLDPPAAGERRFVTFDGIMYQADVWLDGAYLGDPEGYFFPHSFDITSLARLASEHVLAVEVSCPSDSRRAIAGALLDPGVVGQGWNPGGLWQPVRIETTGPGRIDRLRVLCRDANDARAHLRLHARLDLDATRTVTIRTSVDGRPLGEHVRSVARGINEVDWDLDVPEPRLWWPWSLGAQELTDVDVELVVDGTVSDRRAVRTGLREVALHDWIVSVNGERLFAKGANVAPTRPALGSAAAADVRRAVETAREAGLDLLRVAAHVARPEFYDAADELGMLIWQDLPLRHAYGRAIRRQAVRQAREMVDLLGHRPSIAWWCAHDEPTPLHAASSTAHESARPQVGAVSWRSLAGRLLREQVPTWNSTILDRWLRRSIEAADETRPVVAHSGVGPQLPALRGTDSHLSFGWQHGDMRDLDTYAAALPSMVRFVGSFGAASAPAGDEALGSTWPHVDWGRLRDSFGPDIDVLVDRIPPAAHHDVASWRDATQRYQAELLRHYIETLRRLKYRPTGGFCLSQWNDARPGISMSILDHDFLPKAALRAVTDACRPVIVVADRLPDAVAAGTPLALDVHVVNDLRMPLDDAVCRAVLEWPGGSHEWRWSGSVTVDGCVRVGTVRFVVPDAPGALRLDLSIEHDAVVATNRYDSSVTAAVSSG